MAISKKCTSASKNRIRKIFGKGGGSSGIKSVFFGKISFYWEFKKYFCATNKFKKNK